MFTHEVRHVIQNFFFVVRMRSDFIPDANKNVEDFFSDDDIDRERTDVQTLLQTHFEVARDDFQVDNRQEKDIIWTLQRRHSKRQPNIA